MVHGGVQKVKLSRKEVEYANCAFYNHEIAMYCYGEKNASLMLKNTHAAIQQLSSKVIPMVVRVIDIQYEQCLSHKECMMILGKIAAETVG